MLIRLAAAALVTIAAASPAMAAGSDGKITFRIGHVNVNDPADVGRALERIRYEAEQACTTTGTRIANHDCVDAFVAEAISSVKRDRLRVALLDSADLPGAYDTRTASTSR